MSNKRILVTVALVCGVALALTSRSLCERTKRPEVAEIKEFAVAPGGRGLASSHGGKSDEVNNLEQKKPKGRRFFKVPKLFDFANFKKIFKKRYNSLMSEMRRRTLFLGRALKCYLSSLGYSYGKRSSYLAINEMSDWTPAEVSTMYRLEEDRFNNRRPPSRPEDLVRASASGSVSGSDVQRVVELAERVGEQVSEMEPPSHLEHNLSFSDLIKEPKEAGGEVGPPGQAEPKVGVAETRYSQLTGHLRAKLGAKASLKPVDRLVDRFVPKPLASLYDHVRRREDPPAGPNLRPVGMRAAPVGRWPAEAPGVGVAAATSPYEGGGDFGTSRVAPTNVHERASYSAPERSYDEYDEYDRQDSNRAYDRYDGAHDAWREQQFNARPESYDAYDTYDAPYEGGASLRSSHEQRAWQPAASYADERGSYERHDAERDSSRNEIFGRAHELHEAREPTSYQPQRQPNDQLQTRQPLSALQRFKASRQQGLKLQQSNHFEQVEREAQKYQPKYVDHRESGCLMEPRAQGKCGSCYAFAAVSLYEFANCKLTNRLVGFSEQYIVDCGTLPTVKGCSGGLLPKIDSFVAEFGLELRSNYPYREKNDQCPYIGPKEKRGYMRALNSGFKEIARRQFDEHLATSPILVVVASYPDFVEYGGGVDQCKEAQGTGAHAMLIVGDGHEDGRDYWLIRNSHGLYWGDEGYYKLDKTSDCILDQLGWASKALFEGKAPLERNPLYDRSAVKVRYNLHLVDQMVDIEAQEKLFDDEEDEDVSGDNKKANNKGHS